MMLGLVEVIVGFAWCASVGVLVSRAGGIVVVAIAVAVGVGVELARRFKKGNAFRNLTVMDSG